MRLPWFRRSYPVSPATHDWVIESFGWAIDAGFLTNETPLVVPNRSFFPFKIGRSEESIRMLVDRLCHLLNIPPQHVEVQPIAGLPADYRHSYQTLSSPAGTWQADENHAVIRYDPELVSRHQPFIATLVHELIHEKMSWVDRERPGGPEAEELATDLHCISTGFGTIAMNAAEELGWHGYLRQPTRAHALAIFVLVREIDPALARGWLTQRARGYFETAVEHLANDPQVEALRTRLCPD